MKPGHSFTIEPMISEGKILAHTHTHMRLVTLYVVTIFECHLPLNQNNSYIFLVTCKYLLITGCFLGTWKDEQWPDNWTAVTADGKLSAQFEETLLVTDTGVEILTRRREKSGQPYFMD